MKSADCLRYKDDTDRSYGIAGMALAAFILDYGRYINSVSVERRGLDSVEFTPDFYIVTGDNISAKVSWEHVIEQYQIISSMLISNVICRMMVRHHREPEISHHDAMLEALRDYAAECQLEMDESEQLFDKHFQYLNRAYHNVRLHAAAERIVDELKARHTLYYSDLCEVLEGF